MRFKKKANLVTDDTVINYKDIDTLLKFMTPQGKLMPRRRIGCDAKTQHRIRTAILRARTLGLLPYGN
ncbi:MAG: 30S ribosomal protein S18 [Planctomycetes bacterium]|nr:30S ribosomal protein S18 [Planctomycetota bacterium]